MNTICTLGSHCSLQVMRGAKQEGFRTVLVCEKKRENLYKRFEFIDKIILVESFREILERNLINQIKEENSVLIPHGTLISQMSESEIESITMPIFGNKWILRWESDRKLKEKMMKESSLNVPQTIPDSSHIDRPAIAKRYGAAGGKGYFITTGKEDYEKKRDKLINDGIISGDDDLYLQEYQFGVLAYLQYFYSPLKNEVEFFGADRRYESDIDGLARIPAKQQLEVEKIPSLNVVGNTPLVLRESLLEEVFNMGERFVETAKKMTPPGMNGPFCLEGVYDEDAQFTCFEFSARIVAGTNLYVEGSPYTPFIFDEPMSMGRRIARELKEAINQDRFSEVTT